MVDEQKTKVGRIAFRQEGKLWNAYFANSENMNEAIFLGSIALNAVKNPIVRENFIALMRLVLEDAFDATMGVKPSWGIPHSAPEIERGGNS